MRDRVLARSSRRGGLARERGDRVGRLLARPGVVERARADHAQPVGVGVEAGQQVGGRLRDRVGVLRAQRRVLVDRQRRGRAVDLARGDRDDGRLRRLGAHRLEHVERHRDVVGEEARRVAPGLADVGARGEVVDDVGRARRRPRRGPRRRRAGRRRSPRETPATSSPAARQSAARWRAGEAAGARDRGPSRTRGDQVLRRAVPVRGGGGRVDRLRLGLRRVQPPLELAEHARRTAGGARSPARTRAGRPTAAGRSRPSASRSITSVPGQVARCSASPASGAAQRRGAGQARGDVGVERAEQRAVGDVQREPDRLACAGRARAREAAEQLGVVVVDAEHALVERLLRGPHGRGGRAGERAPQRARRGRRPCGATVTTGAAAGYGSWRESDLPSRPPITPACTPAHRERGRQPARLLAGRARVFQPFFHLYFRLSRIGREHVPESGPVIFASNHRSFLDPFVIATIARRPMYYVAKEELFRNRLAGLVPQLARRVPGPPRHRATPTCSRPRRRSSPAATRVLIFPEGTRIRPGALGRPKRGVGRLALETGAPVVPVAVIGTEAIRKGWRIRPHKVRIRVGRPLTFPQVETASPQLAAAVTDRIWPNVMLQWEWLGGLPPLRRAAVIGAGSWGTARRGHARPRRPRGRPRLPHARAGRLAAASCAATSATWTASSCPSASTCCAPPSSSSSRHDLVVLRRPGRAAARRGRRPRRRDRAAHRRARVRQGPRAAARHAADRLRLRARARRGPSAPLGGPAHAAAALDDGASLVLATAQRRLRPPGRATRSAPPASTSRPRTDLIGVELAGCAKNAAALAAAAASGAGPNAAGAAAGKVFAEVDAYARRAGSQPETFAGLAGTGDLVATVLAAGSRNRRAGELLAQGVPAGDIGSALGPDRRGGRQRAAARRARARGGRRRAGAARPRRA